MSRALDMKLDGVASVLRNVAGIAKALPEAAEEGCMGGALVIEGAAKVHAPVRTGMLRSSISSQRITGGAEVGPHVEYGAYQEYGTMYMPAQPYMRPALEEKRGEVLRIVGERAAIVVERGGKS